MLEFDALDGAAFESTVVPLDSRSLEAVSALDSPPTPLLVASLGCVSGDEGMLGALDCEFEGVELSAEEGADVLRPGVLPAESLAKVEALALEVVVETEFTAVDGAPSIVFGVVPSGCMLEGACV